MKHILLFIAFYFACICGLHAQPQVYTVTDTKPAIVDGLQMGYRVRNKEVKSVGDKGDFSRYALTFYITNTTGQAKIILYKQGLNLMGNVSDQLVQFNCLNATGARLTTKSAILNAPACNVTALVEDKDCNSKKSVQNKRFVQIGYWIQAGQTISTDGIVLVPLNEQPNMQAVYLASSLQPTASAAVSGFTPDVLSAGPRQSAGEPGYAKLRNMAANTYVNVETGILRVSPLLDDWWSAQWQLLPVPGTSYVGIRNRWKGHYIGTERNSLAMLSDANFPGGQWFMEPTQSPGICKFRNVASGTYLTVVGGQISLSLGKNDINTAWAVE